MRLRPVPARLGQLFRGLVVASHQHGRLVELAQDIDADAEFASDVAEVAGTNQNIGGTGTLKKPASGVSISV
jgi:hypothetical protein